MRARSTDAIRSILVPVDGSESSRRAVVIAAEMAQAFRADLMLLHVASVKELPVLISEAEDPRAEQEAELVLGEYSKLARSYGAEASVVLRRGHVASQILRHIEGTHPDLVVMGTRALTGTKGALLGSVSRTVSRRARVQVLLVR